MKYKLTLFVLAALFATRNVDALKLVSKSEDDD